MSLKKTSLALFIAVFLYIPCQAQRVVIAEKVDLNEPKWGPNEPNFMQPFVSVGPYLGASPDVKLKSGWQVNAGMRYKRKLNGLLSLTGTLTYRPDIFYLSGKSAHPFPDTIFNINTPTYKSQKLIFQALSAGINLRINFDPYRGNYSGAYLEFGPFGSAVFMSEYMVKGSGPDGTDQKTRWVNLPFINPLQYGWEARLGMGHIALAASYRMSKYFESSYKVSDLPKFNLRVELNLKS